MAMKFYERKFGGLGTTHNRRIAKGKKRKFRRGVRAYAHDGWERKRANGLSPQSHSSKRIGQKEIQEHL